MMQRAEDRGTPSDLQAKILEGLLSGEHRKRNTQPVNQDLPAKNIAAELLNAFTANPADAQLKVVEQKQSTLNAWWHEDRVNGIVVLLREKADDQNPCLIHVPALLVAELLAVSLGGLPGTTKLTRPPSRMECKFAQRLAPVLAQAIKPLLRSPSLSHFDTLALPAEAVPEFISEQSVHIIEFALELNGALHAIFIVMPESKIERRAANLAKAAPRNTSNTVAAEIGKTVVRLDINVQLADQTLEALQNLRVGDILPMTGRSLSEARLTVRGYDLFSGQIGRSGQRFGFQISRSIQAKVVGLTHMVKTLTSDGEQQ